MCDSFSPASQTVPCLIPLKTCPLPDSDGFLSAITFCSPAEHPDVLLVQAAYDLSRFDERLFDTLSVPAPLHLNKAVRKRRAEYLASRVLVSHALCRMGAAPWILHNDTDRAPVWPACFTGSLSHTHQHIALLLAKTTCGKLLGVDCEEVMRAETAEAVQENLITPEEKYLLLASGLPFPEVLTVAFSLKESLYKALFPTLRTFMSFSDAEIMTCEPGASNLQIRLTTSQSSAFPAGRVFSGNVLRTPTGILSWIIDRQ